MTRESIVVLLAIVVFFTPFLGIPDIWRQYIISGAGVFLLLIGYSLRRAAFHRRIERSETERGTDSFTESNGRQDFENQEFAS
jgi:uncharacterized protein (DUF58 family)